MKEILIACVGTCIGVVAGILIEWFITRDACNGIANEYEETLSKYAKLITKMRKGYTSIIEGMAQEIKDLRSEKDAPQWITLDVGKDNEDLWHGF